MTARYGLIGGSLTHSFSQDYFSKKFDQEKIDARYDLFPLSSLDELVPLIRRTPELRGLNVTIPYKEAVINQTDHLTSAARAVGAVNTLVIHPKGRLTGHNTDVEGFRVSLERLLAGQEIHSPLVLGTGGAARAVAHVLRRDYELTQIRFVSRRAQPGVLSYSALATLLPHDFDLVVNTTPVGMYPNADQIPNFPLHLLRPQHFVCDLIYNPAETRLLSEAKARKCRVENGLAMLHAQAEAAWEFWQT